MRTYNTTELAVALRSLADQLDEQMGNDLCTITVDHSQMGPVFEFIDMLKNVNCSLVFPEPKTD